MDQTRLDHLTRFVAQRTGRRALTTGALGGLLATLGSILDVTETGGAKRARRKRATPRCKKPTRRCGKKCVNVKNNRQHCGRCNRKCTPNHACIRGACVALSPPPPPPPPPPPKVCGEGGNCLVFITSARVQGNMGGVAGADAICNQRARSAQLPGTYKAWLSDISGSVANSRFIRNPGPYVLVNGTRIANTWSDVTDGNLRAPINVTEYNQPAVTNFVWTSTHPNSLWSGDCCHNWTTNSNIWRGNYGSFNQTDYRWTAAGYVQCNLENHLYCFQQS